MWKIVFPVLAAVFAVGYGGLIGGFRDADIHDPGVQNALVFAVNEHNSRTNDMYLSRVMEVVSAQTQVVAGIKYVITVKLGRTACRKSAVGEQCEVHTDLEKARPYQCTFTVWSRPWLNDVRLIDEKC
ncbi:cystatin C (amyloid angiopathy and cerebral hemorrhage) [Mugil cephalus]|uniref:cystatin C (amyloid angiopathy and cerebral hemorrhage) n=1 Tax=Mugil cephalus TaxID=48193 RepID=UPI001FB57C80|nr:cystatin C (amyloid angiopathy and cerebral hemorrhage) [Mugil cephalus]